MKKETQAVNPLHVVLKATDKESIIESLGITEERAHEIMELLTKHWEANTTVTGVIAGISKDLQNANELAWVMMQLGGQMQSKKSPQGLEAFIKKMMEGAE